MFRRILFVCVGNICRSPMAEIILKKILTDKNSSVTVNSAGLSALVNHPVADTVQELLTERGLDVSSHRAKQITEQMILDSDLILSMELGHKKQILKNYPHAHGKVFLLGHWNSFEVPDPYRGTVLDYKHALQLIDQGLEDWQKKLWIN